MTRYSQARLLDLARLGLGLRLRLGLRLGLSLGLSLRLGLRLGLRLWLGLVLRPRPGSASLRKASLSQAYAEAWSRVSQAQA